MSYRPSLHPGSLLGSTANSSSSSSAALARQLLEKQREYAAFQGICAQSKQLAQFLDHFADKYDTLDGGSEAVGDVVEHWQNVFRVTGLALASIAEKRAAAAVPSSSPGPDGQPVSPVDPQDVVLPPGTLPDRLVRIPVQQPEEALALQEQ
ncbi:hypothetical protein JCM8097_003598 [Rhodosporidiobolus ruineniae]